jgi:hypothetical protein
MIAIVASVLPLSGIFALRAALTFQPTVDPVPTAAVDYRNPVAGAGVAMEYQVPVDSVVSHNLFRPGRGESPSLPDGETSRGDVSGELRLRGIILGFRPAALLEGLPAQPLPRFLEPGDTLGGWRLVAVNDSSAIVAFGPDSVRLRLEEAGR